MRSKKKIFTEKSLVICCNHQNQLWTVRDQQIQTNIECNQTAWCTRTMFAMAREGIKIPLERSASNTNLSLQLYEPWHSTVWQSMRNKNYNYLQMYLEISYNKYIFVFLQTKIISKLERKKNNQEMDNAI